MNNQNIQTYCCKFDDGTQYLIKFDLSKTPPIVSCLSDNFKSDDGFYRKWVSECVLPDLLPRLNFEQLLFFSLMGELQLLAIELKNKENI